MADGMQSCDQSAKVTNIIIWTESRRANLIAIVSKITALETVTNSSKS